MTIDPRYITDRQGKPYVLYPGLLDQAHQHGLKRVTTKLVQIPGPENGHVAICFAEVETEQGFFTGIGDASPENVSRMMATALIRMSETRAKARAFRDALNVGELLADDPTDDQDDVASQAALVPLPVRAPGVATNGAARVDADLRPVASQAAPSRPAPVVHEPPSGTSAAPPSPKQLDTIARMARAAGKTINTEGMTRAQASETISSLIGEMGSPRA